MIIISVQYFLCDVFFYHLPFATSQAGLPLLGSFVNRPSLAFVVSKMS